MEVWRILLYIYMSVVLINTKQATKPQNKQYKYSQKEKTK